MQAAGGGGGEARPLDMPQGKNKRLPKSLAELGGYCGSCLARSSSGGESGNFALIKRHLKNTLVMRYLNTLVTPKGVGQ